ncbi:MAG: fibronectin type III domain-containing protein, partial [Prevotella sp.]|nr:fibronectin type III domain-containing protein [Prevotella sp.]
MLLIAALMVPWVTQAQSDCTPISTFPVTYGFEASEGFTTTVTAAAACTTNVFNNCWRNEQTTINGTTGSGRIWHIYGGTTATYLHSGAHSLMLPDKGSTSAVSTTMLTFPAMDFTNPGGYIVTFWIQRNGTSTNPEGFKIYVSDTDTIGPNAVELGHYSRNRGIAYPCIESATGWYQYETAPITMTGTVYIIFEGQSYYGSSTYVDDITIMEAPTCFKVSDLAVDESQSTTSSLTLTWSDTINTGATYSIYNFTTTDTTLVQSGVTGTSYTVGGLNAATLYTFAVVTDCGGGDTSMYSSIVSAYTACATLTSDDLPYMENFENYTSGSANSISPCWTKGTNGTTAYPYPYSTAAINSSIGLYFYGYYPSSATGTHVYSWAALPPIDNSLDMSDLMLTLDVKRYSTVSNYYTTLLYIGVADSVTGFNSATAIESNVTWIDTLDYFSSAASSIHNAEVSFDQYVGTGKYVVLYAPTPELVGSSTYAYNYVYVDNVSLRVIPNCFWPTNAVVTSVSTDEAEISWTPDPRTTNPSSWTVEYGEHGFTLGEGNTETSYTTSVTLSNLDANTEYDVYISANCGSDESDRIMISFHTACAPFTTLPYTQNFDSVASTTSTTPTESFLPNCWSYSNHGTRASYQYCPYVYNSSTYAHSGSNCIRFYSYTGSGDSTQYLILPDIDSTMYSISDLQVGFWLRAYSTSTSYHADVVVGVMTNIYDESSFVPCTTFTTSSTTYAYFQHAFGTYTGNHGRIALKFPLPTTSSHYEYGYIDDLTIEEMPNCPPVTNLEAVATTGAALLTWNYQDGYDEPDGYDVVYDSLTGTNPTTLGVTDPTVTLLGLEAGTSYKVYVRANCGSEYGTWDSVTFSTAVFDCLELDPATTDTVQIGNGTTTTYYVPIGQYYNYSYTQQLVLASEMNGASVLTGIDFNYAYATATTQKNNVTIYLANTTETTLANAFVPYSAAFVPVYSGPLNGTQGWNHYEFTTPFNYDGTSNLLIVVHDNSGAYPGSSYVYNGHSASGKARYVQNDSSPYDIHTVSGGTSYANRANMKLYSGECQTMAICAAPAASVTDVTATTVDISWVPGYDDDEWDLDYREAGTATWTSAATGVTSTSYQFANLNPGTDYEFRVSFECSDNNSTVYSTSVLVSTECLQVAIPYTENFDNMGTGYGVMPNCWDYLLTGTSTYTTGTYLPGAYSSTTYAHSGSNCLRIAGVGYHMLPEMSAPLDSLMISFYDYYTSTSYGGIEVGVMEGSVFVPIASFENGVNMTLSTHNLVEVSFASYHGNSRTIALRNYYTTSASTYYSYQYIDDIVVDYIPSCPHVTHLTVDSTSQNSVSLSWTAGNTETEWSVTDGTNYYTTTTPYITVTGLETNTPYTFEVRALCDADDSSAAWTINTRTECAPYMSLPYSENFDGLTTSTTAATAVEIPCWGRLMTGSSSTYQTGSYLPMVYYYSNTSSAIYTHSGLYSLRLYGVGYHTLPQLPCPADSVTIGFWAKNTSASYKLYLGVMSDPNNANTFDTIQEITYSANSAAAAFEYFEINLSSYTGNGRYIAFRNGYTSETYSYHYIDDIEVWHNTNCPSPAVSIGDITNNSIVVNWVDISDNSYTSGATVMWNTVNTTSGAQTVTVASGNSYTITGLNGSTTYYIWVAGECATESSRPIAVEATTASDCGSVDNLTLSGVDFNAAGISWAAPTIGDIPTGYIVTLKQCTNIPFANDFVVQSDTVTVPYYMFNGLEEATTYFYSVTTLCNNEVSEANSGYVTTTICEMDTIGDYATNYSAQPIYATQAYSYTQQIYLNSELAGIDSINSLAIYQRGLWGDYEDRNVTVYLGYTNKNEFESTTDYVPISHLTQVYNGRLSGVGWVSLKFDTTYVRVADSNLVVAIDDNTGAAQTANCYWACSKFDNPAIYRAMRLYSTSNIQPTAPSGTYGRDYYRAYIVFGNAACGNDGCAVPIVMQSATYADHVDISWNTSAGNSYNVDYRVLGTNNWISVATGNTTGTATINGLGASFLGEARVSYTCNGNIVSGITQISTPCGLSSLPLAEDFQSWDYGRFNRPCWVTGLTNAASADRDYPYITSLTGDEDNMLCFMRYGAYVILPEVDTNLNACQIRFKLTQGNVDATIFIGVIDDASMPIQTMHVLDTLTRYDYDTTTSTVSITYSFENIPAAYNHSRIAFWDGLQSYSFIDDIVVELIPACTPASDFSASATVNSATITWNTNGDNATSYYVIYGPRGFTAGQGDTVVATGSPVTLTGLNHSTNYDAYVYTVCDLLNATSTASNVVQFTTDCAPYTTLPYTENFENLLPAGSSIATILPNCWASETGTSAVAHVVYTTNSAQASSPQHAFYMNENGVVALPEMGVPLNTLQLSFHECNINSQSYGLIIGTVDNINTGFAQTFVPYDTVVFTSNQSIYNVTSYFSDYTGTANRIALRNYTIGTGNYSEHYIDDLVIDLAPACIAPQNVHTSYLSDSQVDIVWSRSNSSSYTVEYGVHGFTFGTGAQTTVSTRNVSLTGLTAQTQYDVYVCSPCDTVFYTFTTPCAFVSLPYTEDFDSYTTSTTAATGVQVNCWDYIMTGSSSYQTASYQPQVYYSSTYAHSGSYSLRLYGESYTMLPPMPTSLDSLQLTFWDYTTSTSYGLQVGVMEGGIFIPIQTINSPTSTSVEYEIDFGSYHGNSRIIAFRNTYTSSSTIYYSYHYIDDIMVNYLPTCPKVSTLHATSATTTSITIDWTDLGGSPTEWEIEYTGNGATNVINVNAHPTTISTLLSSTPYSIRVRPICGASDTGMWCNPIRVATECSLVSLPYNEDFESYSGTTYSTAGDLPVCWDGYSNGTTAAYFPHITGSGSYWYPHSGTNALTMTSGSASYGDTKIVALPPFDQPVNSLVMTYWYKMENATNGSTLYVGYVTGPDLANSFVPLKTVTSTTTLTRDSISFDTVPATATR